MLGKTAVEREETLYEAQCMILAVVAHGMQCRNEALLPHETRWCAPPNIGCILMRIVHLLDLQ